MAVYLSRAGYGSLDEVLGWTPFRMSQVMFVHGKLLDTERAENLALDTMAAQGDPKSKEWKAIIRRGSDGAA